MRREVGRALAGGDGLVLGLEHLPAGFLAANDVALGAIPSVTILVAFLHVGSPDALLIDELLLFAARQIPLEDARLRVGELLVVIEEILSTQRRDAVRVTESDVQPPQADVEVVDAVIAHVAAAEGELPAPDAVQQRGLVGHHGRGADPTVEVELRWWRGGLRLADVAAELAVPDPAGQHVADRATAHLLRCGRHVGRAAGLRADLHHAFGAPGRLNHQPAFADVVRAGLLNIDMLAGVAGEDGGGGMPVVGRGDDHGVHGLVLENAPQVADGFGSLAPAGLDVLHGRREPVLIHIANVSDVHLIILHEGLEMIGAHAARADEGDGELAVRALRPRAAGEVQRGGGGGEG